MTPLDFYVTIFIFRVPLVVEVFHRDKQRSQDILIGTANLTLSHIISTDKTRIMVRSIHDKTYKMTLSVCDKCIIMLRSLCVKKLAIGKEP